MEKFKKVSIDTPNGKKILTFRPCEESTDFTVCDMYCPYGPNTCNRLRDPEHYEDKDYTFMDFCSSLGIKENSDVSKDAVNWVPVAGTLEENLSEFPEIFQELDRVNPCVKIKDVIDSVCSGMCDMYDKEHSMCSPNNQSCILIDLLKNKNYKTPEEREEMRKKKKEEEENKSDKS